MKEITIKTNKKGAYIDLEFRRQMNLETFKRYKRVYLDDGLTKTKQQQQAKLFQAEFLAECEEEIKLKMSELSNTMTLSQFIDIYLEYIKNNYSLAYYSDFSNISIQVKKQLGNIKLKDLTPMNIQNFYDYISKLKRKIKIVMPKKDFNKKISKINFVGRRIFEINKSHKQYILKAKKGKKVGKNWAVSFSNYIKIPFDELFEEIEVEEDYGYVMKKKHVTFLRACLSEAKKKLLIKENYAKSEYTSFMKNPEPNKELKVLNEEEFFKLYDYVLSLKDKKIKSFFTIMLNTGARKEEVLGLKWSKIDFKKGELEFSTTITYVAGFGAVINENKTKNASSNRNVSLSDETLNVLYEFKQEYINKYPEDKEGYLFKKENGEVIHPSIVTRWLNNILKEIGLPHCSVHSLRHSYASLMINHLPLASLSKRIGHSQISTTLNIYTHQISCQTKVKNLKNVIYDSNNDELISALNLLKQYHILNDIEYQNKKNMIETMHKNI